MKLKMKKLSVAFLSLLMALSVFSFTSLDGKADNSNNTVNIVEAKRYRRSSSNKVYAGRGRIIGNRRSKIYHVPGQAGYWLNSRNAVYFKTEREAINAGYRKSLR